jgi:hypothetical protein
MIGENPSVSKSNQMIRVDSKLLDDGGEIHKSQGRGRQFLVATGEGGGPLHCQVEHHVR